MINTITVDLVPIAVAVNPVTNKIYVINECGTSNDCSVERNRHGHRRRHQPDHQRSALAGIPAVVLVNTLTNKIYVMNACGNNSGSADCLANGTPTQGTVTVIDGATNQLSERERGNLARRAGDQPGLE